MLGVYSLEVSFIVYQFLLLYLALYVGTEESIHGSKLLNSTSKCTAKLSVKCWYIAYLGILNNTLCILKISQLIKIQL